MYYAEFFRLKEAPFSIAPNPRYLFMSERHREALAHLLYGIVNGNGFVALTGEVGTGKTTLCNCLLDQLPDHVDLALVLNPRVNAVELLATVCDELEIAYPKESTSLKVLIDALNQHLLKAHAQARSTVLLIDEAQNLDIQVLEQIRLLTNLETHETKLLQIILVGQPELNQLLAQKNLRQLNQRITARYHIEPLSLADCAAYIEHRLKVAGAQDPIFTRQAIRQVYAFSEGVPRLINIICDRAMLGAYSLGVHEIDARIVRKAAGEVLLPTAKRSHWHGYWKWLIAIVPISVIAALYLSGVGERLGFGSSGRGLAESGSNDSTRPHATLQVPLQARIYRDLFEDIMPAARSGFKIDPADSTFEFSNSEVPEDPDPKPLTLIKTQAASGRLMRINESSDQARAVTPPTVRFLERIANPELNLYAALSQLFLQWNVLSEPQFSNFCQAARQAGLRCLVQRGTWHYLLSLNRPATLEFELKKGMTRYATLVGLEGDIATLKFLGDEPVSFPVDEILPFWQGQFAMLWKPPAPDMALLMRGYSSPAVPWLRETLSVIQGANLKNPASSFFDKELEDLVMDFQSDHGLNPDGKVGAETFIMLSNSSDSPEVPRLYAN